MDAEAGRRPTGCARNLRMALGASPSVSETHAGASVMRHRLSDMRPGVKYTLIGVAGFFVAIIAALAIMSGSTMKRPAERLATRLSGKPVAVEGEFDLRLLSLTPSVRITGLKV